VPDNFRMDMLLSIFGRDRPSQENVDLRKRNQDLEEEDARWARLEEGSDDARWSCRGCFTLSAETWSRCEGCGRPADYTRDEEAQKKCIQTAFERITRVTKARHGAKLQHPVVTAVWRHICVEPDLEDSKKEEDEELCAPTRRRKMSVQHIFLEHHGNSEDGKHADAIVEAASSDDETVCGKSSRAASSSVARRLAPPVGSIVEILCEDDAWHRAKITTSRGRKATAVYEECGDTENLRFPADDHVVRMVDADVVVADKPQKTMPLPLDMQIPRRASKTLDMIRQASKSHDDMHADNDGAVEETTAVPEDSDDDTASQCSDSDSDLDSSAASECDEEEEPATQAENEEASKEASQSDAHPSVSSQRTDSKGSSTGTAASNKPSSVVPLVGTVVDVLCSDDEWYRARVTKTRGNKARLLFADDEWACLRFPRDLHAVRFITAESGEAAAVKTSSPSSSVVQEGGKDVKASDPTSDSESTDVGSVVGYETD